MPNASRLDKYNNQDLYGLDLCIEVAKRLFEKKISFFFIFVVSSLEKNSEVFYNSQNLIKDLGLSQNFYLTNETLSFVRLLDMSDIVIRPTNTDGDSLTVREAIFFNKIVLASDVVKRPDEVYLFRSRNIDDFEIKIENLIENHIPRNFKEKMASVRNEYKKFYYTLLYELSKKTS